MVRLRSVMLIDDHPVIALGIRLAFRESQRFVLADVASNPTEALLAIERLRPDVVIADLVYDGVVQVALIRECRRILPQSVLIVFSSLPARIYERDVLNAGANRYILKEQPLEMLIAALDDLIANPIAGQSETRFIRRSEDRGLDGIHLTRREVEIGRRLSTGLSAARIGEELGLSPNTVAVHRDNIRKKLNCRDSAELIARLARLYPAQDRHV